MQKLALAIDERPPKAAAAQGDACKRKQIALHSLFKGDGCAVTSNDTDAPGFHWQRLPVAGPAVDEVSGGDGEQIELQERALEPGWKEPADGEECPTGDKRNRRQQQQFVTQASQASRQAGDGRR